MEQGARADLNLKSLRLNSHVSRSSFCCCPYSLKSNRPS
ncbi:hypothetical protein BBJK_03087 [Bifidobacterium bifidum LMG 13195]|uniref:Uncharacterized protein n=1 Tax=Bifidobacterium bifidum LMG 13195 TaxID=1207542 RepID=A0A286TFD8_BIFBI|nr:hypothetical protein BBJK_03087 [Bifidobacterium bifidum LMG 13195]BBA55262.1 hypothetical protein BBTM_00537 [Bifidobacterium bifidum]